MKEIIEKEISLSKEVFHSLPFNNQKNKNKFLGEITNEITHYEDMLQQIYQELENRQKVYLNLKENDYKEYTAVLEQLTKALSYTNNLSTAYEKLKLDKQIYHLVHYQQNNLSKNNQVLKKIIDIFEKAGIPLRLQDFSYTKYVNQYMESFFTYQYCLESGDLEKTFEEIYWKDPYIILELELNIRMLYLKHEKKFEKYVQQVTKQLLSQFEKGESNLIEDYAYLRKKLEQVKIEDKNNVLADKYETVTKVKPSKDQLKDMEFGMKIVKNMKSNAIVIVKDGQTLASGCGQTSRIWALKNALENNKDKDFKGAVLASDAFFPFDDCVTLANEYGISAVVQPGGSIKDQDSIDACDKYEMTMVFTGTRHFKH